MSQTKIASRRSNLYKVEESDSIIQEPSKKIKDEQLGLSLVEQKILAILRSYEYEAVIIHFKEKAISSLELVAQKEIDQKIVALLSSHRYQDIVIKTHHGHITRIEQTIKIKFDKEP